MDALKLHNPLEEGRRLRCVRTSVSGSALPLPAPPGCAESQSLAQLCHDCALCTTKHKAFEHQPCVRDRCPPCSLLPAPCSLLPAACCLLPAACSLLLGGQRRQRAAGPGPPPAGAADAGMRHGIHGIVPPGRRWALLGTRRPGGLPGGPGCACVNSDCVRVCMCKAGCLQCICSWPQTCSGLSADAH